LLPALLATKSQVGNAATAIDAAMLFIVRYAL
jgi:hypothetical protein